MLLCNNGDPEGTKFHTHLTAEEAGRCWGTPALYVVGGPVPPDVTPSSSAPATVPWTPPAPPVPKPRWWDDPSTDSQHWRVEKEGGSVKRAKGMKKGPCSAYIDALQSGLAPKEPDPPGEDDDEGFDPEPAKPARPSGGMRVHGHWVSKNTTNVMVPLLENVPDGRFAVRFDEHEDWTFIRIVRPKHGDFKDCLKVQTQHGEAYQNAWCKWPDGQIGVFKPSLETYLNLLVCDWRGAARQYAKEKSVCARCGRDLTDERSRYYGIGPECERYWPEMITLVDEEKALEKGH